ncbi:MAG: PHP domain-containing protein [Lentisphaerae bacterium]|nr:PHP domain-containing protein [Lentisphaerota bacterium]
MIDLHMHSTFSDGTHPPEELARLAGSFGLTAIALTDHDCMGGVARLLAACEAEGVRGISGVEISARMSKGAMHILGYFVDHESTELEGALKQIREGRAVRNVEILKLLNGLGLELDWKEVRSYASEEVVGRPHFAMAMQARGYVKDKMEAFDRYLAKGKPAYADRFRLSPEASIAVIKQAGGVPVLAHPITLGLSHKALRVALGEFRAMGLEGVEVYYSEHPPALVHAFSQMARDVGLAMSGGSDFHGDANPRIRMGIGFGQLRVPDKLLVDLEARRA